MQTEAHFVNKCNIFHHSNSQIFSPYDQYSKFPTTVVAPFLPNALPVFLLEFPGLLSILFLACHKNQHTKILQIH